MAVGRELMAFGLGVFVAVVGWAVTGLLLAFVEFEIYQLIIAPYLIPPFSVSSNDLDGIGYIFTEIAILFLGLVFAIPVWLQIGVWAGSKCNKKLHGQIAFKPRGG